jgi:hypothetical protein
MAEPWSIAWRQDWDRLLPDDRYALECAYDGQIPHEAILARLKFNESRPLGSGEGTGAVGMGAAPRSAGPD